MEGLIPYNNNGGESSEGEDVIRGNEGNPAASQASDKSLRKSRHIQ